MGGQTTVVAVGAATVAASGEYTAQAIDAVAALIRSGAAVIDSYRPGAVATVPGSEAGRHVLALTGTVRDPVMLPSGYGAVVDSATGGVSIRGGDRATTIVAAGAIDYDGAAGRIAACGGGTLRASGDGAAIDLGAGRFSVTASGAGQVIRVEGGAATIVASGADDRIDLGAPSATPPASGSALMLGGARDVIALRQGGALIADAGGSTTINGIAGSATIFATTGDVYAGGDAVVAFYGIGSAHTVNGGTGDDTVFGNSDPVAGPGSRIVYREGSGAHHIFVTGLGAATVIGHGGGAIFATGGTLVADLQDGRDLLVTTGHGGADTLIGGAAAPTLFASGQSERLVVRGSSASTLVDAGRDEAIDAAATDGGNNFFLLSATGNATLTGSAHQGTGGDSFILLHGAGGAAHQADIVNFHPGSALFLSGYGNEDIAAMDRAVLRGSASFTLTDGTTVAFHGDHPRYASGSVIF